MLCFGIYSILFFRNRNKSEITFKDIIFISFVLRFILLFVNPLTSDDYFRYLWDGKIQSEGLNPYKYSPQELIQFQEKEIFPFVSFPEIKTIYPPFSQIIFYTSYTLFGPAVIGLKIIYLFFDIGVIYFLFLILKHLGVNTNYIFLYTFAPLILFEFFINAHIDIILLFFLSGSIYFSLKNKIFLSFMFLGASVMSKTYSLIFLPVLFIHYLKSGNNFKLTLKGLTGFLFSFLIIFLYSDGIINIFDTMINYMNHWYSNNLPYKVILFFSDLVGGAGHTLVRIILLVLFSVFYIIILLSRFDFIMKIMMTAFCYLFFSHTVHPWYVSVLVLLLPLCFNYCFFFWSGIIGLTNLTVYYYLSNKIWDDFYPVLLIEYTGIVFFAYFNFKNYFINQSDDE